MDTQPQTAGILTTDAGLAIRSWDAWLTEVTGIAAETVRGIGLFEVFPEQDTPAMRTLFREVLENGGEAGLPAEVPYLIACPPQTDSVWFDTMRQRVTIAPLREQQRIVGAIVTIEDITARLEQARKLDELQSRLQSPDEQVRREAAAALTTEADVPPAVLHRLLGDDSWQVRRSVVDGLSQSGNEDTVALLARTIREQHRNPAVLNSALQVLARIQGNVIPALAELLHTTDVDLRSYAVLALGERGNRQAIPLLIEALQDEDVNVRYHAIEGLGKLGAEEAADALLPIAKSDNFFLAFPALEALQQIGSAAQVSELSGLLADPMLREAVIGVLGARGDDSASVVLTGLLNTDDPPVVAVSRALDALQRRFSSEKAGAHLPPLDKGGTDETDGVRTQVQQHITPVGVQNLASALADDTVTGADRVAVVQVAEWTGDTRLARPLLQRLDDPEARQAVWQALAAYGTRISGLLMEYLQHGDPACRPAIMRLLAQSGDEQAVPALMTVLQEAEEANLLTAAAEALASIAADNRPEVPHRREVGSHAPPEKGGDDTADIAQQAFEPLLQRLDHPSPAVRRSVVEAICHLQHPATAERVRPLLYHIDPVMREAAVQIIGSSAVPETSAWLLPCCHDRDESVRQAAIKHLPDYAGEYILPLLVNALEKDTAKVRISAAQALARLGPETQPYLLAALADEDMWVRGYAAQALGAQHASAALEPLLHIAVTDPAQAVRIKAVAALGSIGDPLAVDVLSVAAAAPNPELASTALAALGQIPGEQALSPLLAVIADAAKPPAHRCTALRALHARRESTLVQPLQQLIEREQDPVIVQEAFTLLAKIDAQPAVAALIALSARHEHRATCITLLASLDPQRCTAWIAAGLNHPRPAVRTAVVEVLARLPNHEAEPHLLTALDDSQVAVRLAVVNSLKQKRPAAFAEQALRETAANDANASVRMAAANALSE